MKYTSKITQAQYDRLRELLDSHLIKLRIANLNPSYDGSHYLMISAELASDYQEARDLLPALLDDWDVMRADLDSLQQEYARSSNDLAFYIRRLNELLQTYKEYDHSPGTPLIIDEVDALVAGLVKKVKTGAVWNAGELIAELEDSFNTIMASEDAEGMYHTAEHALGLIRDFKWKGEDALKHQIEERQTPPAAAPETATLLAQHRRHDDAGTDHQKDMSVALRGGLRVSEGDLDIIRTVHNSYIIWTRFGMTRRRMEINITGSLVSYFIYDDIREPNIPRTRVVSTNIASIGYDEPSQTLEIEFRPSGVYRYDHVPPEIYHDLMKSRSKGGYFHAHIRNIYQYRRMPSET